MNKNPFEKLMWSIALPGFGQLLNGKYIKGFGIIFLEFLINVKGNFNEVIISSFHGNIEKAIEQANYQWLMFYPCLYFLRCGMLTKVLVEEIKIFDFTICI